jgi:hypothetical protein
MICFLPIPALKAVVFRRLNGASSMDTAPQLIADARRLVFFDLGGLNISHTVYNQRVANPSCR